MPSTFGRHRVVRRLAEGGMAEVFLCRAEGPQGFAMPVVVKRILPGREADQRFIDMFIDEARLSGRLTHSHIVKVLDFGEVPPSTGGGYYLAMEYVHGGDLRDTLDRASAARTRLPTGVAVRIAASIAKALDYAHSQRRDGAPLGLVHRDVTPHNVLVGFNGDVKLSDFGIALATGRRYETAVGGIKGKLSYLAPEQAAAGELDGRTDLFALGLVLYEMLSGSRALLADSDAALIWKATQADIEPLGERRPDLPDALVELVATALAPEPDARFQTGGAMADALEAFTLEHIKDPSELRVDSELRRLFPEVRDYTVSLESAELAAEAREAAFEGASDAKAMSAGETWPEERGQTPAPAPASATSPSAEAKWPYVLIGVLGASVIGILAALLGVQAARSPSPGPPPPAIAAPAARAATPTSAAAAPPESAEEGDAGIGAEEQAEADAAPAAEAKRKERQKKKKKKKKKEPGILSVNADPYGEVWVDNKKVGTTPWSGEVSPGEHRLKVTNVALGRSTENIVNIRSGHESRRRVDLR